MMTYVTARKIPTTVEDKDVSEVDVIIDTNGVPFEPGFGLLHAMEARVPSDVYIAFTGFVPGRLVFHLKDESDVSTGAHRVHLSVAVEHMVEEVQNAIDLLS